ncbi:MAG: type IV-A pilus assembly ATPase PilB [Deltaproteobacteria bacterium]|nr:type IV-A pilus assembly ATPase PilB [Deltaproteobacteria bacterium]MCB9478995.1 type IV-A pilus assembly ATPase PilB [Deltaproteobacteria bacterium]MCB9487797.1 type IV-A pilus assembly ATPase PilB [Deltaproteobacteria bacterium]
MANSNDGGGGGSTDRLGELLVQEDLISPNQLETALAEQKVSGGRLSYHLSRLGYLEESELADILSRQYGVPSINLSEFTIDPEVIKLVPQDIAEKYKLIPISRADNSLIVAMVDPSNILAIDDIKFLTGYSVEAVVATEDSIMNSIEKYYDTTEANLEDIEDMFGEFEDDDIEVISAEEDVNYAELEQASEDAPVVKLVNLILTDAIKKGASDIHVEPYEKSFRVRYRIDGVLHKVMDPPRKLQNAITSRLKIMSELDIAERRLPQDGRIRLKTGKGKEMDFRVSCLPTVNGEKVVLRLLDKDNLQLDMTKLGFEEQPLKLFKDAIHKPFGMVLVTGPTGSGKTTTLYSALQELNQITENISTAEDPVEYTLKGINQVQMHDSIGLNFAAALRSFLRQDPDVVMVGEIRDFETAEIAVKAALTGHMVLSTLHTNDAPSTVTRLLNMGIEPFLVTASLQLIAAQRLVRKICDNCKEPIDISPQVLVDLGMNEEVAQSVKAMHGAGCAKCSKTGYKGRIALYEVMPIYEEIKEFVLNGASTAELKRESIRLGMKTMRQAGLSKLEEGMTTVDEIVRVTAAD